MLDPVLLGTIATCYGVCGAFAALCQARQIRRRGSSCDVSARFFAMYAGGYAMWLMYGVSIGSVPLIVVDAAGLICGGITLAVTLRMRGSLARPRSWGQCA
jgi:MtN3 and saliva related transmembrane protein